MNTKTMVPCCGGEKQSSPNHLRDHHLEEAHVEISRDVLDVVGDTGTLYANLKEKAETTSNEYMSVWKKLAC